jgi:hypothetical protein
MTTAVTRTKDTSAILHPSTGEVIDVREAEVEVLGDVCDAIAARREYLTEIEQFVSDELVRRLDRRGQWTMRVGDPRVVQFEIKAPSPEAGTTGWDAEALEVELRGLVKRDVIDEEGAAGALERTVTIVADVPLAADLETVQREIRGVEISIAGVALVLRDVSPARKAVAGGIKRLQKVPGAKTAIERARRRVTPPARRAKVTAIRPRP